MNSSIKVAILVLILNAVQSIQLPRAKTKSAELVCGYDPKIDLVDGYENDPNEIYVYTPFHDPNYLGANSIIFMDRKGQPIKCVNSSTIGIQKGYEVDLADEEFGLSFFSAKLFQDNILSVSMQTIKTKDHIYLNEFFWFFMDINFQPIDGTLLFLNYVIL